MKVAQNDETNPDTLPAYPCDPANNLNPQLFARYRQMNSALLPVIKSNFNPNITKMV